MHRDNNLSTWRLLRQEYLLLIAGIGLIVIHLTLVSRANDDSLLANSFLYWLAIGSLVWSKRAALRFGSDLLSSLFALSLLGLVLLKSAFMVGYDPFLRVAPFVSALGLALLASGLRGVGQYWKMLLVLVFLTPPPTVLTQIVNLSPVTAKFSAALLWYSGFDVVRQGTYVLLPKGGIEVVAGCSGVENMAHLLGLSVLFLLLFEIRRADRVWVPIVAVMLAYLVNGVRVALMAYLVAAHGKNVFEYWHKGEGSLLFSMFTVALFAGFCWFLMCRADSDDDELFDSIPDSASDITPNIPEVDALKQTQSAKS
ncbi:MAG: cyanoexosortase A [Cyanobacteria bacterium P01_G01_bin.38]